MSGLKPRPTNIFFEIGVSYGHAKHFARRFGKGSRVRNDGGPLEGKSRARTRGEDVLLLLRGLQREVQFGPCEIPGAENSCRNYSDVLASDSDRTCSDTWRLAAGCENCRDDSSRSQADRERLHMSDGS